MNARRGRRLLRASVSTLCGIVEALPRRTRAHQRWARRYRPAPRRGLFPNLLLLVGRRRLHGLPRIIHGLRGYGPRRAFSCVLVLLVDPLGGGLLLRLRILRIRALGMSGGDGQEADHQHRWNRDFSHRYPRQAAHRSGPSLAGRRVSRQALPSAAGGVPRVVSRGIPPILRLRQRIAIRSPASCRRILQGILALLYSRGWPSKVP